MGRLAVDHRRGAAPRAAEADAGSDLPDPRRSRSGKPLRQIIRDTKRTDFYLDAQKALDYGLIDAIVAGELPRPKPLDANDGMDERQRLR